MPDLKHWSKDEIARIRQSMDRLFDDLCHDFDLPLPSCRMSGDLEIEEADDSLVIRLTLASLRPEEVKVGVSGKRLTVSGATGNRSDGTFVAFRREVVLPCSVRADAVEFQYEDDVLLVRLPKKMR